jgi:adenosylhomocysteine nucleosidase
VSVISSKELNGQNELLLFAGDTLYIVADEREFPRLENFSAKGVQLEEPYPQIIYTGLGKINAAIKTTEAVVKFNPKLIVNVGTAGSQRFEAGTVCECWGFIQRDMNLTEFCAPKYVTTFDSIQKPIFDYGTTSGHHALAICGTGDSFECDENLVFPSEDKPWDLVDMEAFSIAKVAHHFKIPFICIKYISDGATPEAKTDWETYLKKANLKLQEAVVNTQRALQAC